MYLLNPGTRGVKRRVSGWLTQSRLLLYSCTMLVIYAVVLGAWAWTTHGFTVPEDLQ